MVLSPSIDFPFFVNESCLYWDNHRTLFFISIVPANLQEVLYWLSPLFFSLPDFFNETPTEARDFEDNSGQVDVLVIVYIWVMTLYIHDETRYLFFSFHIPFAHSNFTFQVPTSPSRLVLIIKP